MNHYQKMNEYNGWTNKPTWLYNLYHEPLNDECLMEQALEILKESESEQDAKFEISDMIKDHAEDMYLKEPYDFEYELFSFALAYVNFDEIAGHIIEEAKLLS